MQLRSIMQTDVRSKTVIVRASLDVPIDSCGRVLDSFRLERNLETFRWILREHGRCIIIGHRGRPQGKRVPSLSLRPLARKLERMLRKPVCFADLDFAVLRKAVRALHDGDVLLVENLRFAKGEEQADRRFAKRLAALADIYVNDDFANAHRRHASMSVLPKLLPAYGGCNLVREVRRLERLRGQVVHPFVAVVGGAKIYDKLAAIRQLLPTLDTVLVAGGAANTLLQHRGVDVGISLVDTQTSRRSLGVLLRSSKVLLPVDSRIAISVRSRTAHNVPVHTVPKNAMMLDIGDATVRAFARVLQSAKTVLWAGPVGYIENPAFRKGSAALVRSIPRKALSVAGGGDTLHMIDLTRSRSRFSFLSTGGGAMLAFLAREPLPAIEALRR